MATVYEYTETVHGKRTDRRLYATFEPADARFQRELDSWKGRALPLKVECTEGGARIAFTPTRSIGVRPVEVQEVLA